MFGLTSTSIPTTRRIWDLREKFIVMMNLFRWQGFWFPIERRVRSESKKKLITLTILGVGPDIFVEIQEVFINFGIKILRYRIFLFKFRSFGAFFKTR